MDRRSFLKKSAVVGGSIGAGLSFGSRVFTTTDALDIRIFFTQEKYRLLDGHIEEYITTLHEHLQNAFKNVIDIPVRITYRDSPVTLSKGDDTSDSISGMRRRLSLTEWYEYHSKNEFTTAKHSNILIGTSYSGVQGVGMNSLTPSCCLDFESFGMVWGPTATWPMESFVTNAIFDVVAHEIGHNIGLTHLHGGNFESGARSIMLRRNVAKIAPVNIFGDTVSPAPHDRGEFNPKITMRHLSL